MGPGELSDDEQIARFEDMGEQAVRDQIYLGWPQPVLGKAREWLVVKERERKDIASEVAAEQRRVQVEQTQIARAGRDASIVAAALAALALIISLLSWLFPRH